MGDLAQSRGELEQEIRELRGQLAEAQERLRAIREGDVDARVVSTPVGQHVSTLQGADRTYRTIVEQMQEGAVTLVEDGQINYCNQRFAEMLKRPLEEIIGAHFCAHLVEPDRGRVQQLLRQAPAGALRDELTLQAGDGTQIPVRVSLGPVVHNGLPAISMVVTDLTVVGAIVAWRDISQLKQAEAALRASEERMQQALRVSRSFTFDWEPATDRVQRSASCETILKLTGDEAVNDTGQRFFQRVHPDDRARFVQTLRELTPATNAYSVEYRVVCGDGSVVVVEEIGRATFDAAGKLEGLVGVTTDITDRKRAEEALRESESKYRIVADNTHDWVFWCDPEGRFAYCSRSCERITGRAAEEFLADPSLRPRLIHPDDRQRFEEHLRDVEQQRVAGQGEWRYLRPDGTWRWVGHRCHPVFDEQGAYLGCRGSNRDITERKQGEEQLRQSAAALEAANVSLQESRRAALNLMDDAVAARQQAEQALASLRQVREDLDRAQEVGQIGSWRLDVQLNVLAWSDESHRIFGVPKGTPLTYETFLGIVHPDDRQYVDTQWTACLRGEPYDLEHRLLVDGQVKWVHEKAYLEFDGAGKLLGGFGITDDITSLKQTELAIQQLNVELEKRVAERTAELAQANAHNRSLIEAAIDPLVTIGPDGKITDVNAATEAATGRNRKELIGTDFSDCFTRPEKARAGYQQVFREGFVRDYLLEIRHQAGGTTPVLYNASVYRDERGEVIGVFAAARDITERQRAEQALTAERQRLYDVLETLPVYVVLLSTDYHMPFANRFFRERFGESQGRCCFESLSQRQEPCENCATYKVLSTHAPGRWEWTGPDGRDYDIYDFPFVDSDGSNLILKMGIDITERNNAQRAVEASEARYRSFVTASTQLSWTTDAQGQVAEDMPSWRAFTGQSLKQIQGWGWADALHPDDRQRTAAVWSQAVATRSLYAVEYRLRRHDGQYRWLSVRGVPVLAGDTVREWVGACTDITERMHAEEETLRMREELARVERVASLGELTSSLAHELNQPLAAILSNAQAARRFLAAESPDLDQFREILDDIIQDDKRAGSVIHRLRLMLQKGKQEPETFQVNDSIREVIQLLHSEALGHNAALAVDLAAGLPAVQAGRVEVQQVLVNLLLNALDAVKDVPPDRREILVRTRLDQGAVVVAVRDRGCGLPAPDVTSIFAPFFTTKPTGLGMGLAICRRMIEAHGGRIWAANNEDAGATVSFSLPSTPAKTEPSDG